MQQRIITAPRIIPFSVPTIIMKGFDAFLDEHDLNELAGNPDTSIGRIARELDAANGDRNYTDAEILVEFGGRQCYRAWSIKGRETPDYIENILVSKHGSVLAHAHFTFLISGVSRSLSHELIRHAAGVDISEESQRYVDANKVRFVVPPILLHMWGGDITCSDAQDWLASKVEAVEAYNRWQAEIEAMLESAPETASLTKSEKRSLITKRANEAARADLPNACETRLQWTVNARALRHIMMLRGDPAADMEIRRFAAELANVCKPLAPTFFDDIEVVDGDFSVGRVIGLHEKV